MKSIDDGICGMEGIEHKKRGSAITLRSCRLGHLVRCQWRCLEGWVRRLALEVGRGTNFTIPGTKFLCQSTCQISFWYLWQSAYSAHTWQPLLHAVELLTLAGLSDEVRLMKSRSRSCFDVASSHLLDIERFDILMSANTLAQRKAGSTIG